MGTLCFLPFCKNVFVAITFELKHIGWWFWCLGLCLRVKQSADTIYNLCRSVCLSFGLYVNQSNCPPVHPSTHPTVKPSVCPFNRCLSVCPSIHQFVSLTVCLAVCLCLSVCLLSDLSTRSISYSHAWLSLSNYFPQYQTTWYLSYS